MSGKEKEEEVKTLTFNQTVVAITAFLEVAIHMILYVRQIYPADLFIRRKKYDTPVFQSRHPELNEYISGAVKAVKEEMLTRELDKVVVVIKDRQEIALERFIFSIQSILEIPPYAKKDHIIEAMTPRTLGQYFRSFLIKLSMMESQLGLLDDDGDDLSFAILIELKDNKEPSVSHHGNPPPWMPALPQHTTLGASDGAQLHMIRAVETGIINLSLAVQESEEKLRRLREDELKPEYPIYPEDS